MNRYLLTLVGLALTTNIQAIEPDQLYPPTIVKADEAGPWFTGPLLTPSGNVVPAGHQNYEPYFFWTQAVGNYDSHWKSHSSTTFDSFLTQVPIQLGIMPNVEFDLSPQFVYNDYKKEDAWRVSDLPISLSFQLLRTKPNEWYPTIKLRLAANLPLGKYDHLKAAKLQTDAAGNGSWLPQVGVVFTKLHHIAHNQYLSWRLFFDYYFPTTVPVSGLSTYGGSPSLNGIAGTRGKVRLGSGFLTSLGTEYSLSKNWVIAMDLLYQHNNRQRFSGHTPAGTKPSQSSKDLFAVAPAVEYNWNENIGIIAGPWLTIAGRNTGRVVNYVVAINIYN